MKFKITGKNITVTEGIRDKVEKKLGKLEKYSLIDDGCTAKILVRTYPHSQKIEVTIPTRLGYLRAEEVDEDLYAAIDMIVDKLEDQIRRQKTRIEKRGKKPLATGLIQSREEPDELVRTKTIVPDLMSLDEAILRMELLDHNFFIYTDDETGKIAVVYRRFDGGYGLIETE